MQCVFQTIGEHGAKLCIGDGELLWQFGLHRQPDIHVFGFTRKGRTQQIDKLVFTEPLGRDSFQIGANILEIVLCLLRFSNGQEPFNYVQMMAHIVLIDRYLGMCRI